MGRAGVCELALGFPCGGANGPQVKTSCYRCGYNVCKHCSGMATLRKRRVRLCADCIDDQAKHITRLEVAGGNAGPGASATRGGGK